MNFLRKERRDDKRKISRHSENISGLVAPWREESGGSYGAVHQGGADNILELDRGCHPQEL